MWRVIPRDRERTEAALKEARIPFSVLGGQLRIDDYAIKAFKEQMKKHGLRYRLV